MREKSTKKYLSAQKFVRAKISMENKKVAAQTLLVFFDIQLGGVFDVSKEINQVVSIQFHHVHRGVKGKLSSILRYQIVDCCERARCYAGKFLLFVAYHCEGFSTPWKDGWIDDLNIFS